MDMLPMTNMNDARRQGQCQADGAREHEGRQRRNEDILNLDLPETREGWNATQMANHEELFPISDNLSTLMFTVASDLSEPPYEFPFLSRE